MNTGIRPLIALLLSTVSIASAAPPTANFNVIDGRSEADKKQKFLSLSITNCDYSVQHLGDKKTPPRVDTLRNDLADIKGAALDGKTLSVARYDIYFNNAAAMRGVVYTQVQGPVAEFLKGMGTDCPQEKAGGGWFKGDEITTPFSPIIILFEASIDDHPHALRVVYSPAREMAGNFKKSEDVDELLAAMRKLAVKLAAEL